MSDYAPEKRLEKLVPDRQAMIESVGNGALNGATVFTMGTVAAEILWSLSGKEVHKKNWQIGGIVLGAVGAVAGGFYGVRNANNVSKYRDAIANEMGKLEDRIATLEGPTSKVDTNGIRQDEPLSQVQPPAPVIS